MLSFWLMLLISFIIPLHPISLLHTTQCTYTTRTDSILGLSSVRVRINVNGVSKPKRVTNHMRILVQWWCMRLCACSGFLLSGGSGGCFDGILADRTNLKMCTFCMNIMMNIVGHHFQNLILHIPENLHRFSPPESSDVGFVNWRWCLVVFVRINSWF